MTRTPLEKQKTQEVDSRRNANDSSEAGQNGKASSSDHVAITVSVEAENRRTDIDENNNRVDGLANSEAKTPGEEVVKDSAAEVRVPLSEPGATLQRDAETNPQTVPGRGSDEGEEDKYDREEKQTMF